MCFMKSHHLMLSQSHQMIPTRVSMMCWTWQNISWTVNRYLQLSSVINVGLCKFISRIVSLNMCKIISQLVVVSCTACVVSWRESCETILLARMWCGHNFQTTCTCAFLTCFKSNSVGLCWMVTCLSHSPVAACCNMCALAHLHAVRVLLDFVGSLECTCVARAQNTSCGIQYLSSRVLIIIR